MQNLQNELIDLLKHEDNLVIEGHLNKNKIVELALKVEPQLISLLLKSETFKKHFFQQVENVLVFDKIKFQRFVSNKSFLPDSYTAFKNKIGLVTNDDDLDNYISSSNDIVLAWPHKDCVLEGGQTKEDQKRNEIFWNETLAPDNVDRLLDAKVFTNFKKFDKDGEHKVTQLQGNESFVIKGNNLLTISSLLKTFYNSVDFIYIDPPYNTGGSGDTFAYNNSFKQSSWLTFMKNRLVIAKKLLKNDGVICVTIDDYELPRLWVLMDEIFKQDNHLGTVIIRNNPKGRMTTRKFSLVHEYGIFFGKSENSYIKKLPVNVEDKSHTYIKDTDGSWYLPVNLRKQGVDSNAVNKKGKVSDRFYPIYYNKTTKEISTEAISDFEILPVDSNGVERIWRRGKEVINEMFSIGDIFAKDTKNGVQLYFKFRGGLDGQLAQSIWYDSKFSASEFGTRTLDKLLGERELFSYPKAPEAVKQSILAATDKKDAVILDFFGGSGTTAQAVIELNKEDNGNRRFILCEQMDYIENVTTKRIKKVIENEGLGSFIYTELMPFNQMFIDSIQDATSKDELIEVWEDMKSKAFISYQFDKQTFNERLEAFKTAPIDDMKKYLIEILDKNQLYVNYSEIDDEFFEVSDLDKELNKQLYPRK